MAEVYLHIGLPKTATTSLQADFFPFLDNEKYFYAGVRQPRESSPSKLHHLLKKVVASGENVALAQSEVLKVTEQGKSLVVSDEMFVVSSMSVTWQVKMDRLLSVFEKFDFKVLVTIREPAEAIFSFYIEMYSRYSRSPYGWEWLAEHHNDFKIYHYEYLLAFLSARIADTKIKVCKFEDIVSGDLSRINDFLDFPKMEAGYLGITKRNQKKSRKDDGAVPVNVVKRPAIVSLLANVIRKFKFGNLVVVWVWKLWKSLGVSYLERPTEEEMVSLPKRLHLSRGVLCKKHGAEYKYGS